MCFMMALFKSLAGTKTDGRHFWIFWGGFLEFYHFFELFNYLRNQLSITLISLIINLPN